MSFLVLSTFTVSVSGICCLAQLHIKADIAQLPRPLPGHRYARAPLRFRKRMSVISAVSNVKAGIGTVRALDGFLVREGLSGPGTWSGPLATVGRSIHENVTQTASGSRCAMHGGLHRNGACRGPVAYGLFVPGRRRRLRLSGRLLRPLSSLALLAQSARA